MRNEGQDEGVSGPRALTHSMSSTIQLPEDQLIELLLELKASNALFLLTTNYGLTVAENNSRPGKRNPQCSTSDCICSGRPHGQDRHHRYPNISGLVRARKQACFLIHLPMQQTLASFAPRQNGMQAPSTAAIPPHLQAQSSRTGTPQFPTPPPGAYGMGAPRAGPSGYPSSYASGSGGTSVSMGHYNAPPVPQATNQNIPAALAAIPENQRVSNSLGVWDNDAEQYE
jgi:hypothetical protein